MTAAIVMPDVLSDVHTQLAGPQESRSDPVARILLCDDHPVLAQAFTALVGESDDLVVVGAVTSAPAALTACALLEPDLVVMDVSLSEGDGLVATEEIVARWPNVKVLVFTANTTSHVVLSALRAGALGVVPKETATAPLLEALRSAARGETVLTGAAADAMARLGRGSVGSQATLTARQIEILGLAAAGRSRKEIAAELYLSLNTVRSHFEHIYTRLAVSNLAGAVSAARQQGLLT